MFEVEIKVRISDIKAIRDVIQSSGGVFSETLIEKDQYYNAPHRDFKKTDEALRIRETDNETVLTYKGPKETIQGSKVRSETNLLVNSAKSADTMLLSLGFFRVAVVTKKREYWKYQDFSIALDEVEGLGSFIEIELISDTNLADVANRIDRFSKELGIFGERITVSYLELLSTTQ